jgi:serine/threonine-protein kinase
MPESHNLPPDPVATSPFAPAGQGTDAALPPGEQPTLVRAGPPPGMASQPTRIGRYEIAGEIARGGIGAVLRGRDPVLGRDLAIKILLDASSDRSEETQRLIEQRFVEEAQIGGQLQHPGIVPVHELGRADDGRPYFTMKLVKGRTLAELLQERPDPAHDLPRYLKVFEQVCQTVAYAHSRRVIHRDLKPLNVMVGAFGEVQVMDWGLAKVLRDHDPAHPGPAPAQEDAGPPPPPTTEVRTAPSDLPGRATQAGSAWGTLAYMPPEQARGQSDRVDERSDVFALGAILCEILTGQPPYTGRTTHDLYFQAVSAELADALTRLDGCRAEAELLRLAKACLSPQPESRPRDAGQVAAAVAAYLASVQERLHQAEVERAAAQARVEEEAKTRAAAQARAAAERRSRRLTLGLAVAVITAVVAVGGFLWAQQDRAARRERAALWLQEREQSARTELERAGRLREQAREAPPGRRYGMLTEALASAVRADGLLAETSASPEMREQAQALAAEIREEDRNRRMVLRLKEARLRAAAIKDGQFDSAAAAAAYAQAFRDYGIDVLALPQDEAAAALRGRAIRDELIVALDDWAWRRAGAAEAERLRALVRATDPDEARSRLRDALARRDWPALKALAAPDRVANLPPSTVVMLAWALLEARAGAQAEAVLRQAQQRHPNDFWLNHDLASLLLENARPPQLDEAIRFFTAAVALRPESPGAHLHLGNALHDKGRREEAAAEYRRAIQLQPDLVAAYYNLGLTLRTPRRPEEAVAAFRKAIALKPDFAEAYVGLGEALRIRGSLDDVLAAFRKAIELKPDYPEAYNNLGNALQAKGLSDEAVAAFRKAIELKPDYALAYTNLGATLLQRGEFRAALAAYRQAHELGPKQPGWHLPTADWVAQAERLVPLEDRLPALLKGETQPADAERILLARYCHEHRHRYALATRLWEQAFANQPKLAEDLKAGYRYDAACAAARAGCGEGADAARLDDRERARLRGQALAWLRADLAEWSKEAQRQTPEARAAVRKQMEHWQTDEDLSGLRDAGVKLPAAEQEAFQKLWADVTALLVQVKE